MDKRLIFCLGFVFVLLFVSTAYYVISGKKDTTNEKKDTKDVLENSKKQNDNLIVDDGKVLVVYFSRAYENYNVGNVEIGNTAVMASYIIDYLRADSFEIVPLKEYPKDYNTMVTLAKQEQETSARPAIKSILTNLKDYDIVFLGYPIWHGDMPMIVYTFLETYDLKGKIIIPFNTSEGSGNAGTYEKIKNKLINSNVNDNGFYLQGSVARTEEGKVQTINWLKSLGY